MDNLLKWVGIVLLGLTCWLLVGLAVALVFGKIAAMGNEDDQ